MQYVVDYTTIHRYDFVHVIFFHQSRKIKTSSIKLSEKKNLLMNILFLHSKFELEHLHNLLTYLMIDDVIHLNDDILK
jgi:hypothetical protein